MQNTCHNMGYSCESAHLQYRPVRSDRNQRSWSTEPLQLLDSHQPQATTATDRSCTSDSTTTTITNRSPAPNQPPWATATDSSSTSPTRWNLRTEPTPEGTVAAPVTKRRTSPTEPIAVTSSRWHSSFNLLRAPTAVFDGYSTIVLEKLSRFISRHVAAPQHATPPSVPAIPTTRATTKTTSRSAASPMAHTVTPSSRPAPGSSTSSSTVRRHDDEPCRSDGQPVPLGHRAHRQPTQFHAPSVQRDVAASPTTSRPASSHHLVRHSLCLYAASSVLLALCYLTIPTVASDTAHPIRGRVRFAEGKSDKEILDHLLKNSRYDKRLLPPVDDADFCCGMHTPEMAKHIPDMRVPGRPQNRGTLTVNVSVLLLSLASPDESSLKYEVEFLLQQQWFDPRLRYANQSQYEYLNAIHHHEDIWLPDTYFIMHGDFKDPIIPMHFALRIYRNGTINYLMRRHLILSCQGRLNIFPFDDPLCSFALESISYEQSAITYVWKNDEDTLRKSPSLTTLNAYLIQNQTIACPIKASWRGNYSCLKVDLMFTRDRAFYFTTVFIPGIILVTSSFITFWLEWNAVPARVMIGVTTMLNFFTTSNGFRSTLPVVSNLTAMNVWDGVCMCFIYASLLEFVCVNYVGRKRPLHNVVYRPGENPVTQKRESGGPNEIVACTSCAGGTSPCTHSANNGCATETCFVQVRKKEPPHPIRVAKTIDVIARITFPSAYAVFLIFFFIHYKGFS
ncbi:glutamate-gated chloride channel isoform X26 [Anopheles arabiensis]|uniref:glutamate-gated chloride channel isoform X26 n=1 Tax=Anopheles arabiensis TaxID=7173 RepID=UPI001AAE0F99|nr:glutamate-gated chloride channel isoform X26 [Anopheles arabiensis]